MGNFKKILPPSTASVTWVAFLQNSIEADMTAQNGAGRGERKLVGKGRLLETSFLSFGWMLVQVSWIANVKVLWSLGT